MVTTCNVTHLSSIALLITYIVNFNFVVVSYTTMLSIFVENKEWHDNVGVLYYRSIYLSAYPSIFDFDFLTVLPYMIILFHMQRWCHE